MEGLRNAMGLSPQRRSTFELGGDGCCKLSYQQRIIGFLVCFVVGWLIAMLSFLSLPTIALNPAKFAVFYTLGQICALCSTFFLLGPKRQFQSMTASHRWLAALIYVIFIILTLVCALRNPPQILLVVLCVICQFMAAVWYSLSFIPYARQAIISCLGV
uniref:Vesicle transport protein n=1 Tax=Spongospora subterranea TaxID=70186 RepID=A0A0H5RSJ9_9EUKA|eukprot:CRZ11714.1 hypothetical protein [Spongospora subterranea]